MNEVIFSAWESRSGGEEGATHTLTRRQKGGIVEKESCGTCEALLTCDIDVQEFQCFLAKRLVQTISRCFRAGFPARPAGGCVLQPPPEAGSFRLLPVP